MARKVTVGAGQMGPIHKADSRASVVKRLVEHLRNARAKGCELVVFPELALTTFFPRWFYENDADLDVWFEREMPSAETRVLFEEAKKLGIGFYLGYAELVEDATGRHRYNTAILVNQRGEIILKYRKVHLPGHADHRPQFPSQHLEKRYFEIGNLGFPVTRAFGGILGMCICNDRRWAETYRVMALKGAEMILVGYNTPSRPFWGMHDNPLADFHNELSVQAGAYQNCTWVISVAKAGFEDGVGLIGGSCIVAPTGEIVAHCLTRDDELIIADCDFDMAKVFKDNLLNFAANRQIEQYQIITQQAGITLPPE
jgi:N-carbamoyl-D-amino-acid hydrolase